MIPIFLERHKQKILHAGKYLACIRDCGKTVRYPYEEENLLEGILPSVDLQTGILIDDQKKRMMTIDDEAPESA